MRRLLPMLVLAALLAPAAARADSVAPSEKVRSSLVVRSAPATSGAVVGSLRPGQEAEYLETRAGWYRVRLANGKEGFVSAAWSRLQTETAEAPAAKPKKKKTAPADLVAPVVPGTQVRVEHADFRDAFRRFFRTASEWFGAPPPVDLELQGPVQDEARYEHDDPLLPVAGIATLEGSKGAFDIVLVIDSSTSTWESSHADVDGDGQVDESWRGPDSIFRAQVSAAREFLVALAELPHNHQGQRIHVGVVTFAGKDSAAKVPFEASPGALLALAQRDAKLRVPVTGDYQKIDRELKRLARHEPRGNTDFAAGVGCGLAALDVLTAGVSAVGPRPEAQKVIFFLTDGKPMLPHDPDTAERAALYASRVASDAGVQIHSFALGRDKVRRDVNPVLKRMARTSSGRFTQLDEPGEIGEVLRTASFSFVSQVRLVNHTLGDESEEVATGIDGSFYGELPLAEGPNQIEVEAILSDGRKTTRALTIEYVDMKPIHAMEKKLAALREENAALVEQLRERMAKQIQAAKREGGATHQEREVSIRAERDHPTPAAQAAD